MDEKSKKINLPDETLETVVGGFREDNKNLATYGMDIVCPMCHNSAANKFSDMVFQDPVMNSVEYRCKCGCSFVCYGGSVILKSDWIKKCKDKGYVYPYA